MNQNPQEFNFKFRLSTHRPCFKRLMKQLTVTLPMLNTYTNANGKKQKILQNLRKTFWHENTVCVFARYFTELSFVIFRLSHLLHLLES